MSAYDPKRTLGPIVTQQADRVQGRPNVARRSVTHGMTMYLAVLDRDDKVLGLKPTCQHHINVLYISISNIRSLYGLLYNSIITECDP